jgi:hypothetical protein
MAMNGILNGETSEYLQNGYHKPAKLFQASTYFPITQRSPTQSPISTSPASIVTTKEPSKSNKRSKKEILKRLLQRTLEFLGVSFYVFGFVFAPLLLTIISVTILFFPPFWPLAIAYFCW